MLVYLVQCPFAHLVPSSVMVDMTFVGCEILRKDWCCCSLIPWITHPHISHIIKLSSHHLMDSEISIDLTPRADEIIQSFKSLLASGNVSLEALIDLEKFLGDEIDRKSSASEETEDEPDILPSPPQKQVAESYLEINKKPDVKILDIQSLQPTPLDDLVELKHEKYSVDYLKIVKADVEKLFFKWDSKYVWLSKHKIEYKFGKRTLQPEQIFHSQYVTEIMEDINKSLGLELDSCLISRYKNASESLSRHQDDEIIIDQQHAICNVSIGSPRDIQFWNSPLDGTGELIKHIHMQEGSLVVMYPSCQQKLWHEVLQGEPGIRYCLSFRRVQLRDKTQIAKLQVSDVPFSLPHPLFTQAVAQKTNSTVPCSSTPLKPLSHPRHALLPFQDGFSILHENKPELHNTNVTWHQIPLPKIQPLLDGFPVHPERSMEIAQIETPPKVIQKHLIIGDSLVKGLNVPGSIHICKGGIRPNQVLQLLPSSTDVLPPECYDEIRTVTLVVGTNALNVSSTSETEPLLKVIEDYKNLIYDLKELFPYARIGLFNVIPRAYSTIETRNRIELFNSLFCEHVADNIPNVIWIKFYWELIDKYGYLRHDLYGRKGVHLKFNGKKLMANTIMNFQQALY